MVFKGLQKGFFKKQEFIFSARMNKFTIIYKEQANSVILKGSWDNWTTAIEMNKSQDGFESEISTNEKEIEFKFVVDGNWELSSILINRFV